MKEIDIKVQNVYDYAVNYVENNGFPPSIREICRECDIKSTATAYLYLEKLKEKGLLIKCPTKKRAFSLSKKVCSVKEIPIVGVVRAGTPIFAVENLEGYFPLPSYMCDENTFALKVNGDSMINAGIYDKDIIVVSKCESAENGDIIVALIDDCATVKRFYFRDGKYILHPENDQMHDLIFDQIKIIGIVKGLFRKF